MWWKILSIALGVIIALIVLSITIGSAIFKRKVHREVETLFRKRRDVKPIAITEKDIKDLPEPVQRYLRYSQIIGNETVGTVRLKQKGFMRMSEGQKWMPLEAEEYYTTDPPGFIWYGSIEFVPFLSVKAMDMLFEGKGTMLIKLLSLIGIVDARGPEMDQASLVRYLSETIWFPTALLSDNIEWEPIDTNSAKATISVDGLTASGVFHFDDRGELKNFVAERYREERGQLVLEKWSTPITEYKEINGVRIPSKGHAEWNFAPGDFKYIEVELTSIEYNNPSVY